MWSAIFPAVQLTLQATLLLLLSTLYRDGDATTSDGGVYVTYGTQRLQNHSYVDVSALSGENAVHCHSPLHTCCSAAQGPDRGDWFDPWGHPLGFPAPGVEGLYEARLPQRVDLLCSAPRDCVDVSGLYRCDVAVKEGRNRLRRKIYVGLYADGGGEYFIT